MVATIRRWWETLGLATRLHVLIQAVLLAALLLSQGWIMNQFHRRILYSAERRAEVSADGVINGMNMLMVTGMISNPANRKLFIRKMQASEGVLRLRIIRAKQVQAQFGPGLPEEQAVDDVDRQAIASKRPQFRLADGSSRPTLRVVVPFLVRTNFRGTNCLQCHHVSVGSVNGAASITLDLTNDYAAMARIDRMMWLGQVVLQVVLFVLIRFFIGQLTRPLGCLQSAITRIGSNWDLTRQRTQELMVPVTGKDEIGKLTGSFNYMVAALQHEQRRLVSLLSAMDLGIMFVSADNRVVQVNPACCRIWGIPAGTEVVDCPVDAVFARLCAQAVDSKDSRQQSPSRVFDEAQAASVTLHNGTIVAVEAHHVHDSDRDSIGRLWIFQDVTDSCRMTERLTYLAERDSLTDLFNRHRFQEELNRVVAASARSGTIAALILLDLDGFKYANDNFGHGAGDRILSCVAKELSAVVPSNDMLFRLGGDEFTILVCSTSRPEIQALATRVVRRIAEIRFSFAGTIVPISASAGIALYPTDAAGEDELVAHADAAMYQAKEAGGNGWRLYEEKLDASREMLSRRILRSHVDEAIEKGLLRLHFQGIYDAEGTLAHLEALVRMIDPHDPSRLVPPALFIPVAEQSGKIQDLDRWVVHSAIDILARSPNAPPIAVNISGRSFSDPGLAQFIRDAIANAGIAPHRLLFEVTETAVIADMADARRFIDSLHEIGCRICLDDFGTGFASLVYLQHFKVDYIKIDAMFTRAITQDIDSFRIVRAVVSMAHELEKKVVAEGVEDPKTLASLSQIGADFVQGYLFDRPCDPHPALLVDLRAEAV